MSANASASAEALSAELPLEDAASLLSGADFASTKALPERGIRAVMMTDGSNGVAMNLPDWSGKIPATCFPTSSALASSWDPELVERVARAIGDEARAAGADVLLSPGMNLKRSPLGGRNFEYYSEDPLLTARLATAFVRGVQDAGVGACVKHFVANNQETDRMRVSAEVSERALRELYLAAFEAVVTEAKPWLVMASYNRVNGSYVSEDRRLLTGVLREEWGFDGVVVSDWGAVEDRVRAVSAGLDLEMPSTSGASDAQIVEAVRAGVLDESVVRRSAERIIALGERVVARADARPVDRERAAALAVEAARKAAVLVRNEHETLPLGGAARVGVIGALADEPRIQGAGSAGVNAPAAGSIVEALRPLVGTVDHAPGYLPDAVTTSDELLAEAVRVAAASDVAVVIVGLPETAESEGYDRTTMDLPEAQVRLISRVALAAPSTVVVVIAGGVVSLEPWRPYVDAILLAGLAGQGVSDALAGLLVGAVAPSGRLAETVPLALSDSPSYLSFPGEAGRSVYGEGVFVGYRGHDSAGSPVAYPFGHGLTYTTFEFDDADVTPDGSGWVASTTVRNTGTRAARAVVQVYVSPPESQVRRPVRTLAGFAAIELEPGASGSVSVRVDRRSIERWDEAAGQWVADGGTHVFAFGASSRDLRQSVAVEIDATEPDLPLTPHSTLVEWLDHPIAGAMLLDELRAADPTGATVGMLTNPTAVLMIGGLPIHRLAVDAGNALSEELLLRVSAAAAGSQDRPGTASTRPTS
ncbi:glycoside hydrolase family 3 protein [Agromyces fucosus]|uniref:Glycoside hydrolase family 3 protein n=1 Tax=Agromyces fucosus TaxID=41985 RepID=A0A4Q2JQQ2_9MICO|nr:glycoside hydrolase family 3 C-terminal domain-containing protein [Agromyces fucosus]RXZ50615.1 glycoside hydrolase family 3 protein [Agromyces fucosus]